MRSRDAPKKPRTRNSAILANRPPAILKRQVIALNAGLVAEEQNDKAEGSDRVQETEQRRNTEEERVADGLDDAVYERQVHVVSCLDFRPNSQSQPLWTTA